MRVVRALAWNTFLEAIRDKILYLMLGFGIFIFSASRLLAPLALGEGRRITLDVGLTSISLFGCLITIFVGHQLIFREIERKTLYFLFSRPIHRAEFVLGKYIGLALILSISVASMGLLLVGVLELSGYTFDVAILQALVMCWLELMVLAAIAVLIASFTTPVLAGLLTLASYLIGRGSGDIFELLGQSASPMSRGTLEAVSWIVPRLDLFGDLTPVLNGSLWTAAQFGFGFVYALAYVSACLVFAAIVLQRRELTL